MSWLSDEETEKIDASLRGNGDIDDALWAELKAAHPDWREALYDDGTPYCFHHPDYPPVMPPPAKEGR